MRIATRFRSGALSLSQFDTIDPIWRAIAGGQVDLAAMDPDRLMALSSLISAAGVAALIPGVDNVPGEAAVRQARLLNRFRRSQGERWVAALNDAGIDAIAMKGLASALTVWPDPDARAVSDADILVRPDALRSAVELLQRNGFTVAEMPTRGPWGFVGDASFQPLIGPQDGANIDLHIQGDAWPFVRALPAEELIAGSVSGPVEGVKLPSPTHRFLIAASHAAGDLFTADAIKSVVDGMLMLRSTERIDFTELRDRCRRGHMMRPVTVYLALLCRLGADTQAAEAAGFPVRSVEGPAFEAVVRDHMQCFGGVDEPGAFTKILREARLCAEWRVLAWRNWRRLSGLVRPRRGDPLGEA